MAKTLNGSALISYGPVLPLAVTAPDGALFYKTDGLTGGPQGLYMYGFIKDINPSMLGSQVAQGWTQVTSPDLFVLKGGDTMLGSLTVPAVLKVTQTSGAQRILIGNQDAGGTNKPVVLESQNGVLTIAQGVNWSTGGTLSAGLGINVTNGVNGLTWVGNQVWHAANDGTGSTLDSDLLDGQHGSFYQDLGNMNAGVLSVTRGGTGNGSAPNLGGVIYGNAGGMSSSSQGTAAQVLLSGGAGAPTWVNQSALSVGNATNASTANTATTATTAITASTANAVPWTGITDIITTTQTFANTPQAGSSAWARSSVFYDFGNAGTASPGPNVFPSGSLSGFDAYFASDIGQYQVGLTAMGWGGRGMQLSAGWDFEELAPNGLRFRVNDDTGTTSAWGAWRTVWDAGNLTSVSQLTNDAGYVTAGGATGGASDQVFWENDTVVTSSYTITAGKNAMTAGPITINSGVTVTVPSGSAWTIV